MVHSERSTPPKKTEVLKFFDNPTSNKISYHDNEYIIFRICRNIVNLFVPKKSQLADQRNSCARGAKKTPMNCIFNFIALLGTRSLPPYPIAKTEQIVEMSARKENIFPFQLLF